MGLKDRLRSPLKQINMIAPVVTVFDRDGSIDDQGNRAVYDHLIDNGIDGIAVRGSTGEFFAMDMEQRR